MALTSEAAFAERVAEFGLESVAADLKSRGLATFGAFAFCCSAAPGVAIQGDPFWEEFAKELCGGDRKSPLLPGLRRLYSEAFTAVACDS